MRTITTPHIRSISLNAIDREDDSFRMTFNPDLHRLKASMQEVGLFNPVILRGRERLQVVAGFRRILVAWSLGWEMIEAQVLDPDDITIKGGLILNFFENLGTRTFNLIEASMVVNGLVHRGNLDRNQVREEILPLLGLQGGSKVFREVSSLVGLIDEWKDLVVKEEIALPNAARISGLSPEDQEALLRAIAGLKLGHNKMRQCLELAEEICQRDKISLSQLFDSVPFLQLGKDQERNITEKTEMFRRALKRMRYSELTRQEEAFREARRQLTLPPSTRLEPPEFFEGDALKVTVRFRSPEELKEVFEQLMSAANSEALKRLLAMV